MLTETIAAAVKRFENFKNCGPLTSVNGRITARLSAGTGELCKVTAKDGTTFLCEVIGFDGDQVRIMPLRGMEGIRNGDLVVGLGRGFRVPVGPGLLGRVMDTLGEPLDGRGRVPVQSWLPICRAAPSPMQRQPIARPLSTGIRAIDGLLTMGYGQRVGVFAGGGVGKSTLLGEIAKHALCDVNVVALIGERGREVEPLVSQCLGERGLARSIVIVSTADSAPLMRIRAAEMAVTIADWFRKLGKNVLLMLDSITRLAIAHREIATSLDEPPTARGYPPSTFSMLTSLMEQLGPGKVGSITGIMTVLVDGDDHDEPVADTMRATLDGHYVLSRRLAERGHFPAIDVSRSISRLFPELVDQQHQANATMIRKLIAEYEEISDLLKIGAYTSGASAAADRAILLHEKIGRFLRQPIDMRSEFLDTCAEMNSILKK